MHGTIGYRCYLDFLAGLLYRLQLTSKDLIAELFRPCAAHPRNEPCKTCGQYRAWER